ncbi:MAG: acetylxylan esterase, partial [Bryobacteraceae bacterium]
TSCGFTSFHKYMHGDLTGWSHKGYMPRIAERYGKDPARMPFDFPELLAALAPRALFVNAPLRDSNFDVDGVRECVAAFRGKHLEAVYPDAEHDFPPAARNQAYRFLQRYFKMRVDSEPNFL